MQYTNVPHDLRQLKHWVCWQAMPDEGRPGKIKKIPINPKTGEFAQSNNPNTWCSFDAAVSAMHNFSGIGFMFSDSGYFGVDIDGISDAIADFRHDSEDPNNIVSEFIYTLQSYAEFSPSGKGIHIICKGKLPPTGRRKNNVEMYESGRFFTVTGNLCSDFSETRDCTESVKSLHEKYIGGGNEPTTGLINNPLPLNLSESEIIRLAENSKQGNAFRHLYSGQWDTIYSTQSEADLAFCNMLAFWCRCDEQLMDKIFRASNLMRDKWDRKQSGSTYGKITLKKAIRDCNKTYEPEPEYAITIGSNPVPKPKKKMYTFDDTGNAERFTDVFGEKIRYSFVNKKWLYYDGRRWCFDITGAVRRMADEVVEQMRGDMDFYVQNSTEDPEDAEKSFMKHLKQSRSSRAKDSMIKESQHRAPITPAQLDTHQSLLNTPNGIINLRTGELLPHDQNQYITKITNTEYTDKIDCPLWDQFLKDIFNDDADLIRYIQKAVGYSLTGSTKEDCAFFCYGTGRNGKSTFIDVISDALGDYGTNIQPETIMVKQSAGTATSDLARLKGARFITCSEPNEGVRLNEGLLKQLTGGDRVTAAKKYEDEFEFTPEFKLWMTTNHKPIIRGTDVGIWSRIRLIPFTVRIPDDKIDRNLKHKLKQELPGILHWAVEGCLLWQREGLNVPTAIKTANAEYRGEMDTVGAFVNECCTVGIGEESTKRLYESYSEWAKENNEYSGMSRRKFTEKMLENFKMRQSNGKRLLLGISIKEQYEPYEVSFNRYKN